jgi:hypothetical protein
VPTTDAYPHVLTSNLNLDPMLANRVSVSLYLDHPIKTTISQKHIQIDISLLQIQEVHYIAGSKWRHIGKVKDGHHPALRTNIHSLT